MVAETASIVVSGGQLHMNKLITPIRLITWSLATSSVEQNIGDDEQ
jgi:hypothetical protein